MTGLRRVRSLSRHRGNLEIGRFEVTRAQYAESDKGYKFEPGQFANFTLLTPAETDPLDVIDIAAV